MLKKMVEVRIQENEFTRYLYPDLIGKSFYWEVGKYNSGFQPIIHDGEAIISVGRYDIADREGLKCYQIEDKMKKKEESKKLFISLASGIIALASLLMF